MLQLIKGHTFLSSDNCLKRKQSQGGHAFAERTVQRANRKKDEKSVKRKKRRSFCSNAKVKNGKYRLNRVRRKKKTAQRSNSNNRNRTNKKIEDEKSRPHACALVQKSRQDVPIEALAC